MAERRTFAFVRNPFDRLVSLLLEHLRNFRTDVCLLAKPAHKLTRRVERFIEADLRPASILWDCRYVHFSPQIWFHHLGPGEIVRNLFPSKEGEFFR